MNEPCHYCDKPTDEFAGDPGRWPLLFCSADSKGRPVTHCTRCVQLMERDALRWMWIRTNGFSAQFPHWQAGKEMPVWNDIADNVVDGAIDHDDKERLKRIADRASEVQRG